MANDRPVALVTGASSGIGEAYAERLAADHDLVLVARRRDRLQALADKLGAGGARVVVLAADLTDRAARVEVEARAGEVDLLINNAGFGGYQPFVQLPLSTADELLEIHVHAVVRLCRAALPAMIQRGRGGIINVASLLALSGTLPPNPPLPQRAVYGAGKAFQLAFTQLMAGELAAAGVTGVRLQCCLPGIVATEFHTVQGMDLSRVPRMSAADVVSASLTALARGELVCIPGMDDPAVFDVIGDAQRKALLGSAQKTAAAARYKS
ncbi:MAG TPA: SDR family NAD(P)-dependent oxidoreductase [Kofleriaceae bacterium]|nr:SDR family NAD(P)-dependent oxidoreductase [Kofleriaceae bacterium]